MGLPYLTSLILLLDPKTGEFRSVMEGAFITNLRTGAQTAVALKYLCSDRKLHVGLYGAGTQARTQIAAISRWFDIRSLVVFDISKDAAEKFAREIADRIDGTIRIADHPREVAESSEVLICVTQAKEPFLEASWIQTGSIVFPMGSYQEIEDAVILDADAIVVDHVEQCLHRGALKKLAEKSLITSEHVAATIGELACGKRKIEDQANKRVVCIPIGTGAMDVAVAQLVFEKGKNTGVGSEFNFTE